MLCWSLILLKGQREFICDSQLEGRKEALACPLEDALRGLPGAVRGREEEQLKAAQVGRALESRGNISG